MDSSPPSLPAQVPYVGASARQVEHVLSLLRGRPGKMVDLGSGDGRIVSRVYMGVRPRCPSHQRPSPPPGAHALRAHRCWQPTDVVSVRLWATS